jgi:hypothetical protein
MNFRTALPLALAVAFSAPAFAADPLPASDDLRELDVLVVTGATLDGNTQRWADQAGAAAASGENNDLREMDAILVTGLVQDDSRRWAEDAVAGNDDLRELDVLVVTGATLDGNTQRWADQAGAAAASGENADLREMDAIVVTGAVQDAAQRW